MNAAKPKVFLVRAGGDGGDENYALDHGVAILGFLEYPSLAKASDYDSILDLIKTAAPDQKPRAAVNHARQLWAFALKMKEGDIVVLPRKLTSQVALGVVKGSYQYVKVGGIPRHTRRVDWIRPDVPRSVFSQDLLSSFGAFMTVCSITRNSAEERVAAILKGRPDPGPTSLSGKVPDSETIVDDAESVGHDLALAAHDQIVEHIQNRFRKHELANLVDAVLIADGWTTKLSPPGPDGGVDIFAGRGPFGLDAPRLCVQVKSQATPVDVTVYRTLQGSMQSYKAEQGLLVSWGGFNKAVLSEARQGHFLVRLWESRDLVTAIYRTYENLPPEIQAELPLKRVWMLVHEGEDS